MNTEPKPEAIAEDFTSIFQSALSELESLASTESTDSATSAPASEETPSSSNSEGSTEPEPPIQLEHLIQLAMGQIPKELMPSDSESTESESQAEPQTETPSENAPTTQHESSKTKSPESDKSDSDDEDDSEDEEDDAGDWLSQLFKPTIHQRDSSEDEPQTTESPKPRKSERAQLESELQAKIQELEARVKQAEEVAQQVVLATQLRLWVESAKEESQKFQNMVRQYGIELSDQTIEDAMIKALGQLDKNPNALYQELAAAALKEMAQRYTQSMRLPIQNQPAVARTQPNEPRTFEDFLEIAIREMNERR